MSPHQLASICGQLILGGFEGPSLPDWFATCLRQGLRGGVILFGRNLPDPAAGYDLVQQVLHNATEQHPPPLVSLDQEGGRVQRLRHPAFALPCARQLAEDLSVDQIHDAGYALGQRLSWLGFNLNFAPVLDIATNPNNPVIGDRALGTSPEGVAAAGIAFAKGLLAAGVCACGKHFPGHGDTSVDSHLELPVVDASMDRLLQTELVPFQRAIAAGIPALMSAHILASQIDPLTPCTLSRLMITGILRDKLGYAGLVITDDLEMGAITHHYSPAQSAVASIQAGCDMLCISRSERHQHEAHEALIHEAERSEAFMNRCTEAMQRSRLLRTRFAPRPVSDRTTLSNALSSATAICA